MPYAPNARPPHVDAALPRALAGKVDQFNLMTYEMSGSYPGWETWHNSPPFDAGLEFRSVPGQKLPSADGVVRRIAPAAGDRSKLGIGLAFFGYAWKGATGPNQDITRAKREDGQPYFELMEQYDAPGRRHWHRDVEAPYLSVPSPDPAGAVFVTYDDEELARKKVEYARAQGLGGVIVWELGGGWRRGRQPPDSLLGSAGRAAFGS
jgi:chitinase